MDIESTISSVVDLFREILYDILGLFAPGVGLILIIRRSSFRTLQDLVEPISSAGDTKELVLFVGASYVIGYAIQGFAREFWLRVIIRPRPDTQGMQGESPSGLQVKDKVINSEVFKAFKQQVKEYCDLSRDADLSANEAQNLAFAIAHDRSSDAFRFSFRADLCNGFLIVFVVGTFITLLEYWNLAFKVWLITLIIYVLLGVGFGLRAWLYFDIRGRIIYFIGLAALAELRKSRN